jgi:hypothetical protein
MPIDYIISFFFLPALFVWAVKIESRGAAAFTVVFTLLLIVSTLTGYWL